MSKYVLLKACGFLLTAGSGVWTGYSLLQGSLWFGVVYLLWTTIKIILVLFVKKNWWAMYLWSLILPFPFIGRVINTVALVDQKSIERTIKIFVGGMALAVLVLSLLRVVV